jgi:hypothetical protein
MSIFVALFAATQAQAQAPKTICIDGKCYPVVSSEIVSVSSLAQVSAVEASGLRSDSRQFKRALLEAARKARRSGEISMGQHLAVIALAQRPAKLEELKTSVHELAIEDGLATATAIDWMKLIELIIRVLPDLIAICM